MGRFIFKKIFLILTSSILPLPAATVDTTITGDGGPGPYYLGNSFIDSASLSVKLPDSSPVPPWTFISTHNALLFSLPIDSGLPMHVTYTTSFYGVPRIFTLYQKTYLDPRDTTGKSDTLAAAIPPFSHDENLNVTGYKSFGMSIGNFGQVNLEQGLDVRIGGELKPRTTVSAHLSDQGSSLDGATREISDFDMIYLALDDPSYKAIAGDQYVTWPFKGLITGQKKIKGLSALWSPEKTRFSVGAFGALSGGNTAIETKQGRTGVQGPYYLSGKGERDFIQPVGGTMKIRINGKELEEGEDKDYVVDYELGTVTFTNKNLIKNEDLIRLEYEYKLFNYQRTLAGATAAASVGADSQFTVQGVFWSESDNKNHPIDLILSNQDIEALKAAGDRIPDASTARPVHPNDVARESELYPLYKKKLVGLDSLFVYTPYNTDTPDSVFGYYYVWFRSKANGERGRYRDSITDYRGTIYVPCDNPDSATYTDRSAIKAPKASRAGEIRANVSIPLLSATLNVAGQDNDQNLFSSLDDQNNRASATAFSFLAGIKDPNRRSAWLSGSHRYTSRRFDAEAITAYDRKEQWDDTRLTIDPAERQLWEATAGITPWTRFQAWATYGQERLDSALITDKIAPAAQYRLWKDRLSLNYNGAFFRHPADQGGGRREYGTARLALPKNEIEVQYRDEWRKDTLVAGSGLYEGGVSWDFTPLHLHEKVSYMSKRRAASGRRFSIDTGYSARWEQSVNHELLPSWRFSGSSAVDRSVDRVAGRSLTMLVDLVSENGRDDRGFSSRQHYHTSSEIASSFIQIPIYAGKGMGTHIYDSLRREYVPFTPGDYFMQQQEVYDSSSNTQVRKTAADVIWSYSPKKKLPGIANDLSWQGTLLCEEHIDALETGASSWLPGFRSLSSFGKKNAVDRSIRFSDLSYRQEIDWAPRSDTSRSATAQASFTPSYRFIRSYREGGMETRIGTDRTVNRWGFAGAMNALIFNHDDTLLSNADYAVRDYRLELTQRYRFLKNVTLSLLEVYGLAVKTQGSLSSKPITFDSSFYYQIAPTITWLPRSRGTVSLYYTWSVVPLQGDIDFRMARGFSTGTTQQARFSVDIKMGERFLIMGNYRGDWRKPVDEQGYEPANHLFSLEVRVFL